jgi:hypothetical protein
MPITQAIGWGCGCLGDAMGGTHIIKLHGVIYFEKIS